MLRALTWNLWWRFGPFERRQPAIAAVLRAERPDVVAVQEVWSSATDDQVAILADELGMFAVRTEPVLFDGYSFGNALLSRWPLATVAEEPLPTRDGRPGHRRLLVATADSPWGRWPIASTHLDYQFDASATRCRQVEHVLGVLHELRDDPERELPIVLGGDLNAVPDSDEIRMLTGRRPGVAGIVMTDVWEQVGPPDGCTWRRDNPYQQDTAWPDRRLDYLCVSWPRPKPVGNPQRAWLAGHRPVTIDGDQVWASDHAAVVAEVTASPIDEEPPAEPSAGASPATGLTRR